MVILFMTHPGRTKVRFRRSGANKDSKFAAEFPLYLRLQPLIYCQAKPTARGCCRAAETGCLTRDTGISVQSHFLHLSCFLDHHHIAVPERWDLEPAQDEQADPNPNLGEVV
jgi:hypothetical protein